MGRPQVYSDTMKAQIVENLVHDSYYDTALKFGLDKKTKDKEYLRSKIKSIYAVVKKEPDRYGIAPEVLDKISEAMQKRIKLSQKVKRKPVPDKPVPHLKGEFVPAQAQDLSIDRKAIGLRDQMTRILERKLDYIEGSNKEIKKMDLVKLTTAFGTLVDKAQLLQGNATEHIALYARVNNVKDMTAEDAMEHLLKSREAAIENNK